MAEISFRTVTLQKRYPLTISRGTTSSSENLFVTVSTGIHEGIGELAPSQAQGWTAESGEAQLKKFWREHATLSPHKTWAAMKSEGIDPPAMAALDLALWDLLGKQAAMPLYRLLGLARGSVATSVTIGINPPDVVRERVQELLQRTRARNLKIKLGSSSGIEADKEMFMAASEAAERYEAELRVDANGGWSVNDAIHMMKWLASQSAAYIEQPLARGMESELPHLYKDRSLPIFLDESCCFASDVPALAPVCDGVNLKFMKCGGITEALRIAATAKAHGLKTMIGCMSESSVAIAAGAAMGELFDYIDLDSHLNLDPDPAHGAPIQAGVITPTDRPGHGAALA